MFNKVARKRGMGGGEDKIRKVWGWVSFVDKLWRARREKPAEGTDMTLPLEHYWKAGIQSFLDGMWFIPYYFVSIMTVFHFRRFREIKITDKIYITILIMVTLGMIFSSFLIFEIIVTDNNINKMNQSYLKNITPGDGNTIGLNTVMTNGKKIINRSWAKVQIFLLKIMKYVIGIKATMYKIHLLLILISFGSYYTKKKLGRYFE